MKKHGRYELPSVEELLLDCGVDGCTQEYFSKQLRRHKQKHHNDKRHREKNKKFYKKFKNKVWSKSK